MSLGTGRGLVQVVVVAMDDIVAVEDGGCLGGSVCLSTDVGYIRCG